MEREIGKKFEDLEERRRYIESNCKCKEQKSYMKQFTAEELQECKEKLADTMIMMNAVEDELEKIKRQYKDELKPMKEICSEMLTAIQMKAKKVVEDCYKYVYADERMTAYYSANGDLIESRPCTADELRDQDFIVPMFKTGTEG